MIIRPGNTGDALRLEDLEIALFPDNALNAKSLKVEIELGVCYIAQEPGEAAGYILGRWDFKHQLLDIIRLGVAEKFQGLGFGDRLLRKVLTTLNTDAMLCVKKNNSRALRLYHKAGFSIVAQIEQSWVLVRLHR